jgi:hypothetical protein
VVLQIMRHYGYMTKRMNEPTIRRPSLPLTRNDIADLEKIRSSSSERAALEDLADVAILAEGHSVAESVLLHAVFTAGLRAVREHAEAEGYRLLAEEYEAEDAERRAVARRRSPYWNQED